MFSEAAVYAATSRYEPFGLAPLEAALSRCALIMNDIPVFRELWGDAAIYFAGNDAVSLAAAISQVSANAKLREEYADRAYQTALFKFNAQEMVNQYESVYSLVCSAERVA
jgi:glycosyltransferase involved in cell wall biosynthesis